MESKGVDSSLVGARAAQVAPGDMVRAGAGAHVAGLTLLITLSSADWIPLNPEAEGTAGLTSAQPPVQLPPMEAWTVPYTSYESGAAGVCLSALAWCLIYRLLTPALASTVRQASWWAGVSTAQSQQLRKLGFSPDVLTESLLPDIFAWICLAAPAHLVAGLLASPIVVLGWDYSNASVRTTFVAAMLQLGGWALLHMVDLTLRLFGDCGLSGPRWPCPGRLYALLCLLYCPFWLVLILSLNANGLVYLPEYHLLACTLALGAGIDVCFQQSMQIFDGRDPGQMQRLKRVLMLQLLNTVTTRFFFFLPLAVQCGAKLRTVRSSLGELLFGTAVGMLAANVVLLVDVLKQNIYWGSTPVPTGLPNSPNLQRRGREDSADLEQGTARDRSKRASARTTRGARVYEDVAQTTSRRGRDREGGARGGGRRSKSASHRRGASDGSSSGNEQPPPLTPAEEKRRQFERQRQDFREKESGFASDLLKAKAKERARRQAERSHRCGDTESTWNGAGSPGRHVVADAPVDHDKVFATGCAATGTHYQMLGVSRHADFHEIKKSFFRLSKKWHPDKNPGATIVYESIRTAYDCLSDPRKRQTYNLTLEKGNRKPHNGHRCSDYM